MNFRKLLSFVYDFSQAVLSSMHSRRLLSLLYALSQLTSLLSRRCAVATALYHTAHAGPTRIPYDM